MREIRKKRAVAVEVRRERKWLMPVSYTHLTLPTN